MANLGRPIEIHKVSLGNPDVTSTWYNARYVKYRLVQVIWITFDADKSLRNYGRIV